MKASRWLIAGLLLVGLSLVAWADPTQPQLSAQLREMATRLGGAQGTPLASGITYHHQEISLGTSRAQVDYLRIKGYARRYRLAVALPSGSLGTALPLGKLLQERGAIAGINASFFDPATNLPVGFLLINGQMQGAGYGRRAVAGIDLFGRLSFFNPQIGQLPLGGSARLVYQTGTASQQTLLRDAISAGPLLFREGKIVLNAAFEGFSEAFSNTRAARSALGLTNDGALILLVVTRSSQSAGMSLPELARFLQQLSVTEAMALDGGSSSALAIRQGAELHTIGSQRPIPVALVLLPR